MAADPPVRVRAAQTSTTAREFRASQLALLLLLGSVACGDRDTTRLTDRRSAYASELDAPDTTEPPSNDWVSRIGQPVLPKSDRLSPSEVKIEPATLADPEYAAPDQVPVRRLVYRVTLIVPDALSAQRPHIKVPAGELHLDVGEQRVRARFVGPGWPVDEGSEVRLRSDVPGVYVFDGDGGRPMGPGALASWFQGQPGTRARTEVELRHDIGPPDEGPGNLLCAFMAEWSQLPRDEMMPQCNGSIPPGFRFGPWQGDLTALVPMQLPRSLLRADAVSLPSPLPTANARALLDKVDLARIRPSAAPAAAPAPALPPVTAARDASLPAAPPLAAARPAAASTADQAEPEAAERAARDANVSKPEAEVAPPTLRARSAREASEPAALSGESIRVVNRATSRVGLIVQGVPIGWVKPQARGSFHGLAPGLYRIAALRPNGQLVGLPVVVPLPARLTLDPKELESAPLKPAAPSPERAAADRSAR